MSSAVQEIQYNISFPMSLQNDKETFYQAYQDIIQELEDIEDKGIININTNKNIPPERYGFIKCTVDKSNNYFFLSQLQLLKIKYIQYGIYWFNR